MATTIDVLSKIESKEKDKLPNIITYPLSTNTRDLPHITMIELFKYSKKDFKSMEMDIKQGTIVLPLASNLNYSDVQDWEEFDSGAIGAGVNAVSDGEGYMEAVRRLGSGIAKSALETIGGGSADSSFNSIQAASGVSINPARANVYRAPKFREFQLQYNLVAKTPEESVAIRKIEQILRYYASPRHTGASGGFLQAPSVFRISHWSSSGDDNYSVNAYLPAYLPAALVAISVDYNSNGDNYMHEGTFAPIDVKITLAFKELEYDTKFSQETRLGISESNLWSR